MLINSKVEYKNKGNDIGGSYETPSKKTNKAFINNNELKKKHLIE